MITLGPFKPTAVLTLKLFMNTLFDCWGYQDFKNIYRVSQKKLPFVKLAMANITVDNEKSTIIL